MGATSLDTSLFFPVNFNPFPAQPFFPFQLINHTDELVHLAIFDYEECRDNNEAADELFSVDIASDEMQDVQEYLPFAPGNLYLVKAYFMEDDIEMIIQKSNNVQTLNLEIVLENERPVFADNPSFRTLHHWEADRILDRMQI
jgi:hypothetical protein